MCVVNEPTPRTVEPSLMCRADALAPLRAPILETGSNFYFPNVRPHQHDHFASTKRRTRA